jgi:hypothetical protein
MAQLSVPCTLKLAAPARWLLQAAAVCARVGIRIPHRWIVAVTNRSWSVQIGDGVWKRIRIDNAGRVL